MPNATSRQTAHLKAALSITAALTLSACTSAPQTNTPDLTPPTPTSTTANTEDGLPTLITKANLAAPTPMSKETAAIITIWKERVATAKNRAHASPAATIADELQQRVDITQTARAAINIVTNAQLPAAQKQLAQQAIDADLHMLDSENTAYLKSILPNDQWFTVTQHGRRTAHNAALLLQHSPDHDFLAETLERMGPLIEINEVAPADYARLYDRVQINQGAHQFFGTQTHCDTSERKAYKPITDLPNVDQRRAQLGLQPLATFGQTLGIGSKC